MKGLVRARSAGLEDPVRAAKAAAAALVALFLALAGLFGWGAARQFEDALEHALSLRKAVLEAAIAGAPDLEVAGAGDAAGARERTLAILAALEAPPYRTALRPAREPTEPREQGRVAPIAGLDHLLSIELEPGARLRAALAAASPWLLAALGFAISGWVGFPRWMGPALARLRGERDALKARLEAEVQRRETAEALEARLSAALDALEQPVALFDRAGALAFANAAFRAHLAAEGTQSGDPTPLHARGRTLVLASGERLVVLPLEAAVRASAPPGSGVVVPFLRREGGARLADRLQELAELLARVAREAVLLHELASDAGSRSRAEALRGAAERCTQLIAGLLGPSCAPRRRPVALDRVLEERLFAPGGIGFPVLAGIAPGLPAVHADPEAVDALLGQLLRACGGGGRTVRLRLRRDGANLLLDMEPLQASASELEIEAWQRAAARAGASLALAHTASGPFARLSFPVSASEAGDRPRLIAAEEETACGRGARGARTADGR